MSGDEDPFWQEASRQRHAAFGIDRVLSDQEWQRELKAQDIFFAGLVQFERAVREAAALSAMLEKDFTILLSALSDYAPTRPYWDERLAGRR